MKPNMSTENVSDKEQAVGKPLSRVEGRLKVTGQARYAADTPLDNLCHAVLVQSAIANGRVTDIDTRAAENAPGTLAVLTPHNAPKISPAPIAVDNSNSHQGSAGESWLPLQDHLVHFSGQHLTVIVAETLEQAQNAASLVKVVYAPAVPHADMVAERGKEFIPQKVWGEETDKSYGDFEAGWKQGAVRIDATYGTAIQHHVTMEPHATVAAWDGDKLTLYEPTAWVYGTRKAAAAWLSLPEENIRVVAPFVGGSFGCKGPTWPHVALAAIAARKVGRPVKLTLTRPQTF